MRLRAALISILLVATIAGAFILIDDTHDQTVGGTKTHVLPVIGSEICADLPVPPTNGELQYCSDCVMPSHPCVTGGTGAMAAYINGQWECFPGGNAVVLTATPAATATPQPTATPIPSRAGSVWIALGECQNSAPGALTDIPTTGATPGPVTSACATGTNTVKGELTYSSGAYLQSQIHYYLPLNNAAGNGGFDSAGITSANIVWTSTTTSGNVVWDLGTSCVSPGSTDDPSFTSNTVTTAAPGSSGQLKTSTVTLSVGTCSPGDLLHLRLARNAGSGSDTMAGDALAIGIELNVARQ